MQQSSVRDTARTVIVSRGQNTLCVSWLDSFVGGALCGKKQYHDPVEVRTGGGKRERAKKKGRKGQSQLVRTVSSSEVCPSWSTI